jgi:DNA-binding transcriptional ArsR family regulator
VAEIRGWQARKFPNDPVSLVVLRKARRDRQESFGSLIWDNASWHISRELRRWLGKHNREVRKSGCGVRIVSCLLPKWSPWLNAIEPKWVHGKRKVVEPDGLLGAYELAPTGSVRFSIVRITSISLFPRRLPDHALDEVNSSIGLTGGVDGVMILKRERTRADATLFVAGRDVEEEKEFALRWDQNTAGWALVGSVKEYRISQERAAILDLLRRSAPEPLGPKAIAEALDKPYSSVTTLLQKLVRDGLVRSPRYGKYEPAGDDDRGSEVSPQCLSPGEGERSSDERSFTTFTAFSGLDEVGENKDAGGVSAADGETGETSETSPTNVGNVLEGDEIAGETPPESHDEGEEGGEFTRVRSVLEYPPDWMKDTYLKGYQERKWDAGLVANAVAAALEMSPHEDGPRIRPIVEAALQELEIGPE